MANHFPGETQSLTLKEYEAYLEKNPPKAGEGHDEDFDEEPGALFFFIFNVKFVVSKLNNKILIFPTNWAGATISDLAAFMGENGDFLDDDDDEDDEEESEGDDDDEEDDDEDIDEEAAKAMVDEVLEKVGVSRANLAERIRTQ